MDIHCDGYPLQNIWSSMNDSVYLSIAVSVLYEVP